MNTKIRPTYYENNYDPRLLQHMTYRNNISDPVKDLAAESQEMQYEIERKFLFVSSSMRDRNQYPDPASFRMHFPEPFRDIISIELLFGVLPNAGDISGDGYLLLDVPELNHVQGADGSKTFGILSLQQHPNPNYFNLNQGNTQNIPLTFKPIKSRLDALTFMLRHPDGSLVTFGAEDANTPANLAMQIQFTFEIRTRVRKRMGIDRDSRTVAIL
jgi:hypothetical protein